MTNKRLKLVALVLSALLAGAGLHSIYTEKNRDFNAASWGLFVGCLDGRLHRERRSTGITQDEWKNAHVECKQYVCEQRGECK